MEDEDCVPLAEAFTRQIDALTNSGKLSMSDCGPGELAVCELRRVRAITRVDALADFAESLTRDNLLRMDACAEIREHCEQAVGELRDFGLRGCAAPPLPVANVHGELVRA